MRAVPALALIMIVFVAFASVAPAQIASATPGSESAPPLPVASLDAFGDQLLGASCTAGALRTLAPDEARQLLPGLFVTGGDAADVDERAKLAEAIIAGEIPSGTCANGETPCSCADCATLPNGVHACALCYACCESGYECNADCGFEPWSMTVYVDCTCTKIS